MYKRQPSKIRHSLTALFRSAESEDSSLGVNLLRDIRSIFGIRSGKDSDKIYSAELANTLCGIEGSPWAEWDKGRGLTANTLAKRLKPFHISPLTIRTGAETGKGYKRDAFTDAWDRYLAPMPIAASSPVTPPVNIEDYSPFTTVTSTFAADKSSHEKPHQSSVVTAVTPVSYTHLFIRHRNQADGSISSPQFFPYLDSLFLGVWFGPWGGLERGSLQAQSRPRTASRPLRTLSAGEALHNRRAKQCGNALVNSGVSGGSLIGL